MAEEATTSNVSEDSQAPVDENPIDNRAELEKEASTEAVESSEDTSQTSEADDAEPEESNDESDNSDEDAEIRDWAAKKNLPLDDPIKLARMYRESEKALGRKGQEAGQLKDAVSTANTEANIDDVQSLRNELTALSFKIDNNVDKGTEEQMVKVLEDRPWLAGDLDAVLLIAKGQAASTEDARILEARKAGKEEALATVAQAERAAPPKASASTRETPAQFLTDKQVGDLSPAEYAEAKAAGKIQF